MTVQIKRGVTGKPHYLSYSPGQIVDLPKPLADKLIDGDYAIAYTMSKAKAPKTSKAVSAKATKAEKR